eukprot:422065_1
MKIQLSLNRYSVENGVLLHQRGYTTSKTIVQPQQTIFQQQRSNTTNITHKKTEQKHNELECYFEINKTNSSPSTSERYQHNQSSTTISSINNSESYKSSTTSLYNNSPNIHAYNSQNINWLCIICGSISNVPTCWKCNTAVVSYTSAAYQPYLRGAIQYHNQTQRQIVQSQLIQPQSISSHSAFSGGPQMINNTQKHSNNINRTTFYPNNGDKLEDWSSLKVSPSSIMYTQKQHILICGECDFSLTACLIMKCGRYGSNICSTSWYYYKTQWYKGIQNEIGSEIFSYFLENLEFCRNNGAAITFGIDAKLLHCSYKKWNKNNVEKFHRIIFTFPRTYNEKKNHKYDKMLYHKENEMLLFNVLKSAKNYLSDYGEIHIMFLKRQFFNFKMGNLLNKLDLEIAFWCELNNNLLGFYFDGYIPRDCYGNAMKLDD